MILTSGMIQIPKVFRRPMLNLLLSLHRLHHAPARPSPTSGYHVHQQTLTLRAAQQQAPLLSLAAQRAVPLQDPILAQLKRRAWTKANMSYTRTLIPRAPRPRTDALYRSKVTSSRDAVLPSSPPQACIGRGSKSRCWMSTKVQS